MRQQMLTPPRARNAYGVPTAANAASRVAVPASGPPRAAAAAGAGPVSPTGLAGGTDGGRGIGAVSSTIGQPRSSKRVPIGADGTGTGTGTADVFAGAGACCATTSNRDRITPMASAGALPKVDAKVRAAPSARSVEARCSRRAPPPPAVARARRLRVGTLVDRAPRGPVDRARAAGGQRGPRTVGAGRRAAGRAHGGDRRLAA